MAETSEKYLRIFQKGFNYSQDGPGNRLVYHLQGCNMCCPWCANPEGLAAQGCIMKKDGKEKLSCENILLSDVVDEISRSQILFFDGGGITLTGGEPTQQFETVLELLQTVKKRNISTAMENNGTHVRLRELLPYVDYLIMDFKHPDDWKHKQVTGISNKIIKKNFTEIFKSKRQLAVRIPLINGFNTTDQALEGFLDFFQGIPDDLVTFEFLKYHEYGKDKWTQCQMAYQISDGYVQDETIKRFEQAFLEKGLRFTQS